MIGEFPYKGYVGLFVLSLEDKDKIIQHLKEQDEDEFGYLNSDIIMVVDALDEPRLEHLLAYNGKYDPNVEELIKFLEDEKIKFVIMSANANLDDSYHEYGQVTKGLYSGMSEDIMSKILDEVIAEEFVNIPKSVKTDFQSGRDCPTRTACIKAMQKAVDNFKKLKI
jgi:hypothetical protein